ncbi:MAG: uncharacterized protein KVP18_000602 [Porospora cf. gigantea A]|uniref:uncharacterized protein n=1 Tax=Porospora cf. gigantea A TaxID=2853593 RepID=UPI00355A0198|nr:MAG: hypothetical protein KVP18_000602 [Porospora cf. gigantea A]
MKHPQVPKKDMPKAVDEPQQSQRTLEMKKAFNSHGAKGLKKRLSRIVRRTKTSADSKDAPAAADVTWQDMSPKRLEAVRRDSNVLSLSESPISLLLSESARDTS